MPVAGPGTADELNATPRCMIHANGNNNESKFDMEVYPLQSGSSGNCTLVSAGDTTILIDAGLSARKCTDRLTAGGYADRPIDALVISHDHADHTSSMGVLHRRFGAPIHITPKTLASISRRRCLGRVDRYRHFDAGTSFDIGSLRIESYATPHDAADGVCFVVEHRHTGIRFGLMTDLGHVFAELHDILPTLDAVLIESNYDPQMLRHGLYPRHLKERIIGPRGHISNDDAATLIDAHAGRHLQWVCLGHLSDQNNRPDLAIAAARGRLGKRYPLFCADRYAATEAMMIAKPRRSRKSRSAKQLQLAM